MLLISDAGHLHICHKSFTDFLLDPERSKDFWVDPKKHSLCLAESCMKFMSAKLKFNFFNLKTSHVENREISNLTSHVENVKSTALDHASHFWAIYLQKYSDQTLEVNTMVQMENFLMNHFLHWLEVMSIMGSVNHAAQILLLAKNWSRAAVRQLADAATAPALAIHSM